MKRLPIEAHEIRFLSIENEEGFLLDLVRLLGLLHGIRKSRMAVRHAESDPREAREYFRESVPLYVEV